jgi:hypothetical protein
VDAVAGDDPESGAITEVMIAETKQAPEARPMRISYRESRGEMRLARAIECLPVRGEKRHSYTNLSFTSAI